MILKEWFGKNPENQTNTRLPYSIRGSALDFMDEHCKDHDTNADAPDLL